MSAWVVSKTHIDLLVRAALHAREVSGHGFSWWAVEENGGYAGWRELDEFAEERAPRYEGHEFVSPSALGQILVNENVMSVHHRYPDDNPDMGELPGPVDAYYMGPYVYENPGYTLTPGEVFAAIDCLDYQSCEHDEWMQSEAYAFLRALRVRYCQKVEGYAEAPHGWEQEDLAKRPREFSRRVL
jgi:hypothetical protein